MVENVLKGETCTAASVRQGIRVLIVSLILTNVHPNLVPHPWCVLTSLELTNANALLDVLVQIVKVSLKVFHVKDVRI